MTPTGRPPDRCKHPVLRRQRSTRCGNALMPEPERAGRAGERRQLGPGQVRIAAALLMLLAGCGSGQLPQPDVREEQRVGDAPAPAPQSSATPTRAGDDELAPAAAVLEALVVKGRGPMTDYSRSLFGQAWTDVDRNGCDTRSDTLRRDLTDITFKPRTNQCLVLRGALDSDPYTGKRIEFVKGGASEVDVDHVVALGNAYVSGAAELEPAVRLAIANDPLNLLTVDASANRQKGDGDAATWLPANKRFRCDYVSRQVAVKSKYTLSVTVAEKAAISRVLASCPGQPAPPDDRQATSAPVGPSGKGEAPYASCAAARAAGASPLNSGEPGYSRKLDGDGDGVACE